MSPKSGLLGFPTEGGHAMRTLLAALAVTAFLPGCAAPVIMAANLAAAEAFTAAANPELAISGADLAQIANWEQEAKRTTVTIFGRDDWLCALREDGGTVCVPPDDVTAISSETSSVFACQTGQGGMVANIMDKKNLTTLFCKREDNGKTE